MIGWFFDMLVLLSVTVTVLKFALNGTITAEQAGLILVAAALIVAVARIAKISICRLLYRIVLPVGSLVIFARSFGEGNMYPVIMMVLLLLMMLFGVYIMIAGAFKKK